MWFFGISFWNSEISIRATGSNSRLGKITDISSSFQCGIKISLKFGHVVHFCWRCCEELNN